MPFKRQMNKILTSPQDSGPVKETSSTQNYASRQLDYGINPDKKGALAHFAKIP